jgi:hypothetical protein
LTATAMPTTEHADIHTGILVAIEDKLERILHHLRRAEEWGAIDSVTRLPWAAGGWADFNERGDFRGVMVINETAADMTLGFAPGAGARAGQPGTLTIPSRGWIVLPIRGVTISVGAVAAGSATVIALAIAPAPAMGPSV